MTTEEYQQKRQQLLDKKLEVEQRLLSVKETVTRAKREFAATGKRADSLWLTDQESYIRRLGSAAQELQRQLGQLKEQQRTVQSKQKSFEQFVHDVLVEQMTLEQVAKIFREARYRFDNQAQ